MTETRPSLIKKDETLDDLILGGLKLIQSRRGYRFSLDAVLLAYFSDVKKVRTAVDLGTGNGVIPLLLSHRSPCVNLIGIEIQDSMVERARRGIKYNKLENRIKIMQEDIKNIDRNSLEGIADLVVSNPPFWKKGEGRVSINPEVAVARHEIHIEMGQIITAASHILQPEGKLCMVQRADRLPEIMKLFEQNRLVVKRLRMVHSYIDREAKLILIEGQKTGTGGFVVFSPLIIYEKPGEYCKELKEIYQMKD